MQSLAVNQPSPGTIDLSPALRKSAIVERFNSAIAFELMWDFSPYIRIEPEPGSVDSYREVAELFRQAGYFVEEKLLVFDKNPPDKKLFFGREDEYIQLSVERLQQEPKVVFDLGYSGGQSVDSAGETRAGEPISEKFARAMVRGLPLNHPLVNREAACTFAEKIKKELEQEIQGAIGRGGRKITRFLHAAAIKEAFNGVGRFGYRNFNMIDHVSYNASLAEVGRALTEQGRRLDVIHIRFALEKFMEVSW